MHILTAQVMYLLHRGEVEVVIAVYLKLFLLGNGGVVFLEEERTGYGSRPRIGNLAVPLLCKEAAGGVGSQTKETGQRTLRR